MNDFLYSVLVSFYKDTKDLIKDTLDSFVNQVNFDLSKLEIVVVDDGSGLDISEMINSYKEKLPGLRFYPKEHGDRGSVYEYAKAQKLLHGKYFTVLDSDDIWDKKMLSKVTETLVNDPDVITCNFYRWYPTKNKKRKVLTHWLYKDHFYDLENKPNKIWKLKTPYSWPIGKFYKTEFFYNVNFEKKYTNDENHNKDEILFHICPDVVLFYEIVKLVKKWCFISTPLAYARVDRPDSFTNRPFDTSKVRTWVKTINYLNDAGGTSHAIMYAIQHVKSFGEAYYKYRDEGDFDILVLNKKYKMCYIPKVFEPAARLVFKSRLHRLSKKIPIKLV